MGNGEVIEIKAELLSKLRSQFKGESDNNILKKLIMCCDIFFESSRVVTKESKSKVIRRSVTLTRQQLDFLKSHGLKLSHVTQDSINLRMLREEVVKEYLN